MYDSHNTCSTLQHLRYVGCSLKWCTCEAMSQRKKILSKKTCRGSLRIVKVWLWASWHVTRSCEYAQWVAAIKYGYKRIVRESTSKPPFAFFSLRAFSCFVLCFAATLVKELYICSSVFTYTVYIIYTHICIIASRVACGITNVVKSKVHWSMKTTIDKASQLDKVLLVWPIYADFIILTCHWMC